MLDLRSFLVLMRALSVAGPDPALGISSRAGADSTVRSSFLRLTRTALISCLQANPGKNVLSHDSR